ncbi:MAG: hypothetical protein IJW06_06975 [Clostridia bacterium]|nr:hypothetical protein [Clostridia bacterium]
MDNINGVISAKFSSKGAWITLWAFAVAGVILSLRALSLIMPKTCIALSVAAFVFSVLGTLVGVYAMKTKLEIDEKFICYKTFFGKQLYLPIDSVTGVKGTLFSTVGIYAPSFRLKCCFVKNKDEIIRAIKEKLENRK